MSVITISWGSFSGGALLAEALARELGYRCIDRDTIIEKAAASRVPYNELMTALDKPPKLWERFEHKRYMYLALIKAALAEEVRAGKIVYHGHAGHLLLSGCPVLRVRVIAPLEYRIRMAAERLQLSREQAISHVRAIDQQRKKWTRYLYGVDWEDSSLYDAVINLESLDVGEACAMVAAVARQPRWFEFSEERRVARDDFARASRVAANIISNPKTEGLELDVTCQGGAVQIAGKLSSEDRIEEVERVAREVPGVTNVSFRFGESK